MIGSAIRVLGALGVVSLSPFLAFAQPATPTPTPLPVLYFESTIDPQGLPNPAYNFFGQRLADGSISQSPFAFALFDPNGNGLFDVVAGAPYENAWRGAVSARDGNDGDLIWIRRGQPADVFGRSVAIVGDVSPSPDGVADVVVGAPQSVTPVRIGYVELLEGLDGSLIHRWDSTNVAGLVTGEQFGTAVEQVTDIDGDGYPDIAIGSENVLQGINAQGCLRIFKSRAPYQQLFQTRCGAAGDRLSSSLAAGRFYGDPLHIDLAVGAQGAVVTSGSVSSRRGTVQVYRGTDLVQAYSATSLQPLPPPAHTLRPNTPPSSTSFCGYVWQDKFGQSLSELPLPPSASPGRDRLLVGAPGSDSFSTTSQCLVQTGAAYAFDLLSPNPTVPVGAVVEGGISNENFGASVHMSGDLDGDGALDWAVGNPTRDTFAFQNNGEVRFFSSATHAPITMVNRSSANNAGLGVSLAYGLGRGTVAGEPGIIPATGSASTGRVIGAALDTNVSGVVEYRGVGCTAPGRNFPLTLTVSRPTIGQNLTMTVRGAVPNSFVWLVFIDTDTLAQPFLISESSNGCIVTANPDNVFGSLFLQADATGTVVHNYFINNNPGLVGATGTVLAVDLLPPSGPNGHFDLVTSQSALLTVGTN